MTLLPTPSIERPDWLRLVRLAGPALAQQALILLIQHTDQWLATPYGAAEKAALTTANYFYWIISCYSVIISAGATALVGRSVGATDIPTANRATGQSLLLALIFGIIGSLTLVPLMPQLSAAVGLTDHANQVSSAYLTPLLSTLAFQMIETAGIACLVGAGDTRTGLYILASVMTINGPIGYFTSRGIGDYNGMGFLGIAWGTAVSHVVGCFAVLTLLLRGRSGLKVRFRDLKPDFAIILRLLRVSIPAAFDSLSVAFCQLWFLRIVNGLGDTSASAHGIALRWEALGYLTGAAFGVAASALVSQNLGAGRPQMASREGWMTYLTGALAMSIMGAIFYSMAYPMCEFYSPNDEQVVELGVKSLRTVAFTMPALAAVMIFTQALRSAGDARIGVLISWFGFLVVRIPLAYTLTDHYQMGLFGAWLAMFFDLWVRGILFTLRFASGRWQTIKV